MNNNEFGKFEKEHLNDSNSVLSARKHKKTIEVDHLLALFAWIVFCITWVVFSIRMGGFLLRSISISIFIICTLYLAWLREARE